MAASVPLILIRHAQTLWNAEKRLQGKSDQPLSAAGLAEVKSWRLPKAVERHREEWLCLSSPLQRARQTADALFGRSRYEIEPLLTEMDWGDWEGCRLADLRADPVLDMPAREAKGLDLLPPGGESPRAVQARLAPLLVRLQAAGRPVCALSHKGVIRALLAQALDWNMTGKSPVKIAPASAQYFTLGPGGAVRLQQSDLSLLGQAVGVPP